MYYTCYMLIQILQSKGQLLMSRARPIARGLGQEEWLLLNSIIYGSLSPPMDQEQQQQQQQQSMDRYHHLYVLLISRGYG
jgi:hypothetical protein